MAPFLFAKMYPLKEPFARLLGQHQEQSRGGGFTAAGHPAVGFRELAGADPALLRRQRRPLGIFVQVRGPFLRLSPCVPPMSTKRWMFMVERSPLRLLENPKGRPTAAVGLKFWRPWYQSRWQAKPFCSTTMALLRSVCSLTKGQQKVRVPSM